MDNHPRQPDAPQQPPLSELLEACRPAGEDLSAPEMAPLMEKLRHDQELQSAYNRIRLWDRQIQSALSDVPIPAGLVERLHAAVAEAAGAEPDTAVPEEAVVSRAARSARQSRRWWILSTLAAAAAVALIAFLFWPAEEPRMSAEQWAEVVHSQWLAELDDENWKTTFPTTLDTRFPVDASVKIQPDRWQMLSLAREPAVAYSSMQPPDQAEVLLFVLPTHRGEGLPIFPPVLPDSRSRTGQWSIGVWKSRGNLYALAVEGDPARYRSLLRPQPGLVLRLQATDLQATGFLAILAPSLSL